MVARLELYLNVWLPQLVIEQAPWGPLPAPV
jgi:hypothetical protein